MDVRVVRVETGEVMQSYLNVEGLVTGQFFGTPAAGPATYVVQVRMNSVSSSGGAYCFNRGINAVVEKR